MMHVIVKRDDPTRVLSAKHEWVDVHSPQALFFRVSDMALWYARKQAKLNLLDVTAAMVDVSKLA